MKNKIELFRKKVEKNKIEQEITMAKISNQNEKLLELTKQLQIVQEGLQFVEDISNSKRNEFKSTIESLITEAIREIYGNTYRIELDYSIKNNRSYVDIILSYDKEKGTVRRTMEGFGGGMADAISVPLRLLVILSRKNTDRVCILDEAYKHMDDERIEFVGKFLKTISKKMDIQIIMSTHHQELQQDADKIFFFEEKNKKVVAS